MLAADGRDVWFHDSVHAVVEDGRLKEMIGVMVDITDRKRVESSVIEMTGRLISAQEEERRRIARELHDDFNQRLALLSIGLERLEQNMETDATRPSHIGDLRQLTREITSDVHRLSHQLHPAKLEHLGLVAAIKGLCRELSEQYGADIDFLHRDVPTSITKESALCLFRVAQEALSNTIKHSGVRNGRLELFGDRGILHLCISDGGAGFDSEVVSAKGRLGLISIQERVHAAGGTIAVESRPLRGTRISVHLAA
jgi:signal transduction histidine kinase